MTRRRTARRRLAVLVAVGVLVLTACARADPPDDGDPAGDDPAVSNPAANDPAVNDRTASDLTGTLTVYAAASLTETFTELGDRFMADHPGLTVTFSFGGSPGLAAQITSGAPADVFAAASTATMGTVVDAGANAGEPEVFARNALQIAVPSDNPAEVTGLRDLTRPELTIALCAVEVPCGAAAEQVFAAAGLVPSPDTLERDVRAVLTKVELGEVDAGLVYRTDVVSARGAVTGIEVPGASEAMNDYPVVVLAEAGHPEAARAFVELIRSPPGQRVLADAGFAQP